MGKNCNKILDDTKKEIYKDGIKPIIIESGKTLSLIPRVVKNVLSKVEIWCLNKEFIVKELELELQKKLEKHKIENIVDADPSIFIPSVQAISYNWDKNEIKELYLNLMVSDMDKSKKNIVHPSFSEIIKQMDSIDVKIFTKIYNKNVIPLYMLGEKSIKEDDGSRIVLDYLLTDDFYEDFSKELVVKSLNNLERLKLIDIPEDLYYTDDNVYSSIETGVSIQEYRKKYLNNLDIKKGLIKTTLFGKDFYEVCCN